MMKQRTKVLSVVLALVMLLSVFSAGFMGFAASASDPYGPTDLGDLNSVDKYDINDRQYASILLDWADNLLADLNLMNQTMSVVVANLTVNLTSINSIIQLLMDVGVLANGYGGMLGNIGDLDFSMFTTQTKRANASTPKRDLEVIDTLRKFLNENAVLVGSVMNGIGSGGFSLGTIGNALAKNILPDDIMKMLEDIPGLIRELLFGDKNANVDNGVYTLITELLEGLDIDFLKDFTFEQNDTVYDVIEKAIRSVVNWGLQYASENAHSLLDDFLPGWQEEYPFLELDFSASNPITYNWANGAFTINNENTYFVYNINNILYEIVVKAIPSFMDSSDADYTGGWISDQNPQSTNTKGAASLTVLDQNIQRLAKWIDRKVNLDSALEGENLGTNVYACALARFALEMFFPALNISDETVLAGNIGTMAVQALNEFMMYYMPENALTDLYTYEEDGPVLSTSSEYSEARNLKRYKSMGAQIIAQFIEAYLPLSFDANRLKQDDAIDYVLEVVIKYFLNDVATAQEASMGALGQYKSNDTPYTAIDRIIFSMVGGSYKDSLESKRASNGNEKDTGGAIAESDMNQSGILFSGLLPTIDGVQSSEKVVNTIFDAVEGLSIGTLLKIFVPNKGTNLDMNTNAISAVGYTVIRLINVVIPGTFYTDKTALNNPLANSPLNNFLTAANLRKFVANLLGGINTNIHMIPLAKGLSTLLGLTSTQVRGDLEVDLATKAEGDGSEEIFTAVDPIITSTANSGTASIPSGYYLKLSNTTTGIPGGYTKANGEQGKDEQYQIKIRSISSTNASLSFAQNNQFEIQSASNIGYAISGTATVNQVMTVKIEYVVALEDGMYDDKNDTKTLYYNIFFGSPKLMTSKTEHNVLNEVPQKIYASLSMMNDVLGYARYTGSGDSTLSGSSSHSAAPITNDKINFAFNNAGSIQTTKTSYKLFSVSTTLTAEEQLALSGTYSISYQFRVTETTESGSTEKNHNPKPISWVLFYDYGLADLVSELEAMNLQESAYPGNGTAFSNLLNLLATAKAMLNNPEGYISGSGNEIAQLETQFEAMYNNLEAAYDALEQYGDGSKLGALQQKIDTWEETYKMWDYTGVSWNRYSSALSDAKALIENGEKSALKIDEAIRMIENVMAVRLVSKSSTITAKIRAEFEKVYNYYSGINYVEGTYTTGSYDELVAQLANSKAVKDNANASISQLADARRDLLAAVNQLTIQPLSVTSIVDRLKTLDGTYGDNLPYAVDAYDDYDNAVNTVWNIINDPYGAIAKEGSIEAVQAELEKLMEDVESYAEILDDSPYVSTFIALNVDGPGAVVPNANLRVGSTIVDTSEFIYLPANARGDEIQQYVYGSQNVSRIDGKKTQVKVEAYRNETSKAPGALGNGYLLKLTQMDDQGNEVNVTWKKIIIKGTIHRTGTMEDPTNKLWTDAFLPLMQGTKDASTIETNTLLSCDLNGDGKLDAADYLCYQKFLEYIAAGGTAANWAF